MAAAEGANVVVGGRSEEKLRQAKGQIEGRVEAYSIDVTDEASVRTFFDKVGEFNHLSTSGSESDDGAIPASWISGRRGKPLRASSGGSTMQPDMALQGYVRGDRSPSSPASGARGRYPESSVITAINSAIEGLSRSLAIELAPIRVKQRFTRNHRDTHILRNAGRPERSNVQAGWRVFAGQTDRKARGDCASGLVPDE